MRRRDRSDYFRVASETVLAATIAGAKMIPIKARKIMKSCMVSLLGRRVFLTAQKVIIG